MAARINNLVLVVKQTFRHFLCQIICRPVTPVELTVKPRQTKATVTSGSKFKTTHDDGSYADLDFSSYGPKTVTLNLE